MSSPFSKTTTTADAIVVSPRRNKNSQSFENFVRKNKQSAEAYKAALLQRAARIRSELLLAGINISVAEALQRTSFGDLTNLIYITTLKKRNEDLRTKLFGA